MPVFRFRENDIQDPAVVDAFRELTVILENLSVVSSDADAIHDNISAEISAVTEKVTPVSADLLIGEDSASSNSKVRIQIGNLPSSGGATQLSDLTDVNTSTVTNRNVLVADGVDFESRALLEADISDLQSYLINLTGSVIGGLSDVTISAIASGEVLKWDGSVFINNTLAEAGIAATVHTHLEADITDLQAYLTAEVNNLSVAVTWANIPDANVPESAITQHEAALTVLETQITDGSILARVGSAENIADDWNWQDNLIIRPVLKDYGLAKHTETSSAGTLTIDMSLGNVVTYVFTENISTVTVINPPASGVHGELLLKLVQHASAAKTITWQAKFKFPEGDNHVMTTGLGATDFVHLMTVDGGINYFCTFVQNFS